MMILRLKEEIVAAKKLSVEDQEQVLQDVVDECLTNGVLITRLKSMPRGKDEVWTPMPSLKVCVTTGLSKKEIEKAGVTVRHAITKVLKARK